MPLLLVHGAVFQNLDSNVLLLARIKNHMREELAHVPNYTCLESIARFHREPDFGLSSTGRLRPLDSVVLEIVYSNRREWYGSPGESVLRIDNPVRFIGSGMIGDGAFAITLSNILEGANFTYHGEEPCGGRRAVRYDFRLSRQLRGLQISIVGGSGVVGESGSMWADLETLDLIRLESHADEIPPFLPLQGSSLKVNYSRTKLGQSDVLLAQQADLHMLESSGVESYNRIDFTHCRTFSTESSLQFDQQFDQEQPRAAVSPLNAPARVSQPAVGMLGLPALLLVTVRLTTPITSKDAVGKLVEGRVSGEVRRKGKLILPDASRVHGRIRRLERFQGNANADFIIGLEFTDVEVGAVRLRFYADLLRMGTVPGLRPTLSEKVLVRDGREGFGARQSTISLRELPGVASFFMSSPAFEIPSGFYTTWRTRSVLQEGITQ